MFNERKVAQMAAYLLQKRDGTMPHLKLMKLLYLSDRESLNRYGFSISGDHPVSMPHGPVLTMTLDYLSGNIESSEHGWDTWISDKADHQVSLVRTFSRESLDELSDANLDVLDDIDRRYGGMDKYRLRDFTHTLPEWRDPHGSSNPIPFREIFLALGRSEQEAVELSLDIDAQVSIDRLFAVM